MPLVKPSVPKEYWALAALLLLAVFVASPGFFSIDEAIYYLGARAIAEQGSLGLHDTGYAQLHSESLKLRFLVDGPQGLTPQYPAGSALLAAPLLGLLGPRAFVLLNALAAIGMIFAVRSICISQFHSERIARIAIVLMVFGTFWLEYAVGVWPHMLSAYFAVQAYWFALRYLESGGGNDQDALLSGLFAGAGVLFRLDAVLAVPAIGLIMVLFAPCFARSSVLFGMAVLPSLVLASGLSFLKFGTLNPFSYGRGYGQSGGNVDLLAHLPLLVALCLGLGILVLLRIVKRRPGRKATVASLAVAVAALLLIPITNDLFLRALKGFWALVVDIRTVDDPRIGIKEGPGGTRLFWFLPKKALGQSMPWIGLIAIMLTAGVRKDERRFVATLFLFMATMTLPFILLSWHGGGGGNMRYFLPILPALCILSAWVIHDLWPSVPNAMIFVAGGFWGVTLIAIAWFFLHPSRYAGVHQIVSTYLLLATILAALAAGRAGRFQQSARKATITLVGGGLLMSMGLALSDLQTTEVRRAGSHNISLTIASLPARSLVITFPEWAALRLPGNGSFLASREPEHQRPDHKLITEALNSGYRVFITSLEFDPSRDLPRGILPFGTNYQLPDGRLIELRSNPPERPVASASK